MLARRGNGPKQDDQQNGQPKLARNHGWFPFAGVRSASFASTTIPGTAPDARPGPVSRGGSPLV